MKLKKTLRALVALVLATSMLAVAPSGATAQNGPSVPLPDTKSVGVSEQQMGGRDQDQAGGDALHGDQSAGGQQPEGMGDSAASPLAPSSTWQVSGHTGDFSWSYPLRVPPAPGDLEPDLALSYSSSSVDGRTSATNNQASWVGDGWDLSSGFVERVYGACAADTEGGTKPPKVGDLCWRNDNAVASFGAGGGMVIKDATTGVWRLRNDDGARIELLKGADNGDDDGEHWKITTVDGTQYFFGSRSEAKSAWTVPVFGDDAGEPCHAATFAASHCAQAWRWNLDRVVDPHGNEMVYFYDTETNSYGRNLKDDAVSYVRGGTLNRIEYGLNGTVGGPATGKVVFTTADRCVPGSQCTDRKEHRANWPDVEWDYRCDTPKCEGRYAPSFWSTKRLARITTQVRDGDGYRDVDTWTLEHQFPAPGDGEKAALWLRGITHQGMPAVTFEGVKLPNRVSITGGAGPLLRYRVSAVLSETGGLTTIRYAKPDCTANPAKPEENGLRCFPARWSMKDGVERQDYFHKYVVDEVTTSDRLASSAVQSVRYEYLGGAAWRFNQSEFVKDDKKSWDEYRGYGHVKVHTGTPQDPSGPVEVEEQWFHRGMDGDKLPGGGTRSVVLKDSEGGEHKDHDWIAGFGYETQTHDGDHVIDKAITTPTWRGPTATRGTDNAYMVDTGTAVKMVALESGGWRTTRSETTYDDKGQVVTENELGDLATPADDRCTRTTYARNDAKWIHTLASRVETVAVHCAATPSFPRHALADRRLAYDGQDFGAPPVRGDVTKEDVAEERPAAAPKYVTAASTTYDAYGRPTSVTDALNRTTSTAYTPATGGPLTGTAVTNAKGHVVTTTYHTSWGTPVKAVDQNGRVTETDLDEQGRTIRVWASNTPRSTGRPSKEFSYLVRADGPSVTTSKVLGPNGDYLVGKLLYDSLGRERQVQRPTEGGRLIVDTRYDSHGRVFKTTQPYFNAADIDDKLWSASDVEIAGLTRTEFDGAGRTVASVFQGGAVEKWRTTTAYGGDRVHVTPPAGAGKVTRIHDAQGQVTELRQYNGDSFDTTRYAYTAAGQLESVTDPSGNTWRWSTDLLGRTFRMEDPDRGVSTRTFDLAGQVKTTTDGRGVTLNHEYDVLGRRTFVRQGDTTLQEFRYDTALFGKGQPASATRYVNGNAYTDRVREYSPLYQPLVTSVDIPEAEGLLAGTYTSRAKYNPDGSPMTTVFAPAGDLPAETVLHGYDAFGRPSTLSGGYNGETDEIVAETSYTRYGEAQRLTLGEAGKRVWLSHYYDQHTRQLNRKIVDAEVPAPMQADINYTYDPAGNITSIADLRRDSPADVQCFRYDHLRRLTEAWTPKGGCAAAPVVGSLGGPAPYWQSFGYDRSGNRLTETEHAAAGDVVSTYAYPPTGHALRSVTTTGPTGTDVDEFGYDAVGNTLRRKVDGRSQTFDWDPEGLLVKITEGEEATEFLYSASGGRLIRRDPAATTLYLGDQEIRVDRKTGAKKVTRFYAHGGESVAARVDGKLTWIASDHQGTPQLTVDSVTLAVSRRRQMPFGEARGERSAMPVEKGFVGSTVDESTSLLSIGARQYDSGTGRFVTTDPMMDIDDPQQLNGFAYGNNNPVTFSDPTGLACSGPDGIGCLHKESRARDSKGNVTETYEQHRARRDNYYKKCKCRNGRTAKSNRPTNYGYRNSPGYRQPGPGHVNTGIRNCPDGKAPCRAVAGYDPQRAQVLQRQDQANRALDDAAKRDDLPAEVVKQMKESINKALDFLGRFAPTVSICGEVSFGAFIQRSREICYTYDNIGITRNSSEKWGLQLGVEMSVNVAIRVHSEKAGEVNKSFSRSWSVGVELIAGGGGGMEYERDSGGARTTSFKTGLGAGAVLGPKWTFAGDARTDGYVTRWK